MDCSWLLGNKACYGGQQEKAFEYLSLAKVSGIDRESDYPYTGKNSFKCRASKYPALFKIHSYKTVAKTNAALMAAVANQPISISMNAYPI